MRQRDILYVTVDGILQPLGYSQVARVVLGLSKRGLRYQLLSFESQADLADRPRVREMTAQLSDAGIVWTHHPYDQAGTPRAAATNLTRLGRGIRSRVASGTVGLVHARAYKAALLARVAKGTAGIPFLFDARGRWIDERLLARRWFTNPIVEAGARRLERQLYGEASALVTLTQLHADDIAAGDFGAPTGVPLRVITTCADFDSFRIEARERRGAVNGVVPNEIRERLRNKLVVGFVGSTNAFYRYAESLRLAQQILARRGDSHLLILSPQQAEFRALVERAGLPQDRVTITRAAHRDMPAWLAQIDWAIQLLNGGVAKRGSMPTKLAEFFASGVEPLHFGCNEEVTSWVRHAGSGYVLNSLEERDIIAAAEFVATRQHDPERLRLARARAQPHFDLASGLDAYASLLGELGYHGS